MTIVRLIEDARGDLVDVEHFCDQLCAADHARTFNHPDDAAEWPGGMEEDADQYCASCGTFLRPGLEHAKEPAEDDLVTADHIRVYSAGRLVLRTSPDTFTADVRAYMDRVSYWPDVWFVSDHGNAHLVTLD